MIFASIIMKFVVLCICISNKPIKTGQGRYKAAKAIIMSQSRYQKAKAIIMRPKPL